MSAADEAARVEAERRYSETEYSARGVLLAVRRAFGYGAAWQRSQPVEVTQNPQRLDPDFRADLIEFARDRIEMVWADAPDGVDAPTLASNIVAAQEFCWMSRQVPVAQPVDVTDAMVEALDIIAHIVSQANVNPVTAVDKHGEYIARYDMPVGSIHKAIPFLARFGIVVDQYGHVYRANAMKDNQ